MWGRPATEHKILPQGNEPLHSARDVALVSLRTNEAIVGGVLACEIPGGGTRYVGSGLSNMKECDVSTDGSECQASR